MSSTRVSALNQQFGIANALRFEEGEGGLIRAVISTSSAEGDLYLHGAHVTHWKPRGQRPVLFLSPASPFASGKAIRGGVPIVFPWFGPRETGPRETGPRELGPRGEGKPGPAHGFARTMEWDIESTRQCDDKMEMVLALGPTEDTSEYSPAFHLRFRVVFGAELEVELVTRNDSNQLFTFEEAFHTYFAVSDIHQVSLAGLNGTEYIDKTDGFLRKIVDVDPFRFQKETDQMHLNTKATCIIDDPAWKRRIVIAKTGSDTTVVWNPWQERNSNMPDMATDGWTQMLCVESANAADNAVTLAPSAKHTLSVTIRVESTPEL